MENYWLFSHENEKSEEPRIVGGFSIADFLCKKKPDAMNDSKSYSFLKNLTVPIGLSYLPVCDSNKINDQIVDEPEREEQHCENFDKLFYLSASDLGKSRDSSRKTRKKIPQ
jgi:hypothetical protein